MPVLTVIAGPNGSGKSTITSGLDFAGRENLLDPDAIAHLLSPSDPRHAAIASGREVVRRIQNYLGSRVSFAVETRWRADGLSKQCGTRKSTDSG